MNLNTIYLDALSIIVIWTKYDRKYDGNVRYNELRALTERLDTQHYSQRVNG